MIIDVFETVNKIKEKESNWKKFFSPEGLEGMKEFYVSSKNFEQVSVYIRFHDIVHELLDEDGFEPPIIENFEEKNASVGDIILVHDAYNINAHGFFFECLYSDDYSVLVLDKNNEIINIPHGSYYTSIPISEFFENERNRRLAISRERDIEHWKNNGLSFFDILDYESVLEEISIGAKDIDYLVDKFTFEHENFYQLGKKRIEENGLSLIEQMYLDANSNKKSL